MTVASGGAEGIRIVEDPARPIDVVLTDVVMPRSPDEPSVRLSPED